MGRSLKKGPFVEERLMKRIDAPRNGWTHNRSA